MKVSELKRFAEIGLVSPHTEEADLSRPQYDSRKVQPGDAFFAIRGFATDGHQFIAKAIERGAKTIVIEDAHAFTEEEAKRTNVVRLVVENSRRALAIVSEQVF